MNEATIRGFRRLHEDTTSVLRRAPMTAPQMAETSHRLSKAGDMATLHTGEVYIWDARFEQWTFWKGPRLPLALTE